MDLIYDFSLKLAHYFNIEMTERNKKRLRELYEEYSSKIPPVIRIKEVTREIRPPKRLPSGELDILANEICEAYNITLLQLKYNSPREAYHRGKKRLGKYVDARQDFSVRAVRQGFLITQISDFLHVDHTTVVHYLYHRKTA